MRKLLFFAVLALFLFTACQQHTVESAKIKIGVILPLSGDAAPYGETAQQGIDMALAESGMADKIHLVYEDTTADGETAVNVVNKLVNVDKVVGIVGALASGATIPASSIAQAANVPMVSPASTSPDITSIGPYMYRTIPSDAMQGVFTAQLMWDDGHRTIALLYSNEDYGIGFSSVVKEAFEDLGGEVVASETFDRSALDLRTQLTKVKSANPDAISMVSNNPDNMVAMLRQIKELEIDADLYGAEGFKGAYISEHPEIAEGIIISSVSFGNGAFAERHTARYGAEPGIFAAQGYDALMAYLNAIKEGATTGPEIKAKLDVMRFEGATGTIQFDQNGDVGGNYDVVVIQDGQFISRD